MNTLFEFSEVKFLDILHVKEMTIQANTITCLVGESGKGKTTLLKLFNQLLTEDAGIILYKGQDIKEIDTVCLRREVVMLPQMPVIYPGTVRDNLLIGCEFALMPLPSEEQMVKALEEVRLVGKIDVDASKLSGGEKQRVSLLRVMFMQAEVYLLDEPSSALDDDTEDFVIDYIVKRVKKDSKSMIMVTHSKEIANKYADRIITL